MEQYKPIYKHYITDLVRQNNMDQDTLSLSHMLLDYFFKLHGDVVIIQHGKNALLFQKPILDFDLEIQNDANEFSEIFEDFRNNISDEQFKVSMINYIMMIDTLC